MSSRARWGLSLAVLVGVAALAIRRSPEVISTLAAIDGRWAVAGVVAFWGGHLLRSVRLRRLAGPGMRLWPTAVTVNAAHAVAVYFLPLQAGELALPGVLGWVHGRKLEDAVDVLVRSRLLDVSALGVWVAAATVLPSDGRIPPGLRAASLAAGLALALSPWIVRRLGSLGRALPGVLGRVSHAASRSARATPAELGLSLAIWALSGLGVWAAARAVGVAISFGDVWLLLALQLPLQFLPVQGVANAGSHELSWVLGLRLLGFPAAAGLAFALASHALILCYVATLVPLGATVWLDRSATAQRGGSAGSS